MSERQPEPPMKFKRSDDDEPDVEGHRLYGVEDPGKSRLNDDESDDSQDTGEGRSR